MMCLISVEKIPTLTIDDWMCCSFAQCHRRKVEPSTERNSPVNDVDCPYCFVQYTPFLISSTPSLADSARPLLGVDLLQCGETHLLLNLRRVDLSLLAHHVLCRENARVSSPRTHIRHR